MSSHPCVWQFLAMWKRPQPRYASDWTRWLHAGSDNLGWVPMEMMEKVWKKKESKLANHFCTYLLEHEVSISAYYSRLVGGFTPEKYQLGWVIIHEFHDDIPNKNGKIWKNLIQSCSSHQPAILCCVDTWLMHSKITCWEARPTVSPMDSPQSSAMRLRWSFFHWPQPMMSVDRICNTYRYWYIYIYI